MHSTFTVKHLSNFCLGLSMHIVGALHKHRIIQSARRDKMIICDLGLVCVVYAFVECAFFLVLLHTCYVVAVPFYLCI